MTLGRSTPADKSFPQTPWSRWSGQVEEEVTTPDYTVENGTGIQVPLFPIAPEVKGTEAQETSVRLGDLHTRKASTHKDGCLGS